MLTAIRLSSCSTGTSYSCSKRRKRREAISLSRQSPTIPVCTIRRMNASCSSFGGRVSFFFSHHSIASWTTLPAHIGSAESFFSRLISSSSCDA